MSLLKYFVQAGRWGLEHFKGVKFFSINCNLKEFIKDSKSRKELERAKLAKSFKDNFSRFNFYFLY